MGNREFATKLMNQAVQAATHQKNPSDLTTAYQLFASSAIADPTWGTAWYQGANNNFDLKKLESAVAGYRRALFCDLDYETRARAMLNLGWCFHLLGRTREAYDITQVASGFKPDMVQYWLHLSVLYGLFGDCASSVDAGERAVELAKKELDTKVGDMVFLEKQYMEARIALAFALLFDGQYKRGFDLFELRFEWRLHSFLQFPYERWRGERGKTVFLVADQGLGDTLSFARFVERACSISKYVHAYIQPPLMRVFMHAFNHIPNLNLIPSGNAYPQADVWTTFVSLPFALGLTDAEVREAPQIKPPVYGLPTTWMVPDVKLHIGIAWAGSPLNDIDKYRNIPVEQFLDLYRVPGIQLYGLQIGDRQKELHESGAVSLIRDLSTYINDVADTVAILQNLDLVICCESALGHICALAGKECWVPYSYMGRDYRIGQSGEKLMWTPRHQIFSQGDDHRWQPVFDRIVSALQERMANEPDRKAGAKSSIARAGKIVKNGMIDLYAPSSSIWMP
jgi:tetratricopeptide (TPR) repeat protein